MKISQLVATKNTKQYHESVASRLPRGIKSQQQLLNLGYSIAVHDLGLSKAKSLSENFAAKLINSYHNQSLNEGVGSFLGKVAGNVVGGAQAAGRGLKGAWADAKQGYADAKAKWDEKPAAGPTPAAGTAPAPAAGGGVAPAGGEPAAGGSGGSDRPYVAPAGGSAPAGAAPAGNTGGDLTSIMQAIDKLDKPSKQQLAGDLEKSIASTPEPAAPDELDAVKKNAGLPTGTSPATPGATPPATPPATPSATPGATPPATPAPGGQALDLDQLKKDREAKLAAGQAGQQQAQQQMAATAQANAATNQQDAAIKAAADAAKAKSGFQQTAADKLAIKQAADKGIKEAEELEEGFHSNFLGMKI